jgi:hypothetical protein
MTIQNQYSFSDSRLESLVLEVTSNAVAEMAPEELDYIDELIRPNDNGVRVDDALAFGIVELVSPLTPAIWMALAYAMKQIFDATVNVATDTAKNWIQKQLELKKATVEPIPIELASELHTLVISIAIKYGLTEKQALRLSVLLIERLEKG